MSVIKWLLGLNWKTGLAGWTIIIAAVGRILVAYKTKDFGAIFTDGQLILTTVVSIAAAFGLIKAKDQNVTGAGEDAVIVHKDGSTEK